mmetsp:Transcript_18659/g.44311  ORF Transcript_18659/g.44311 Transcript_18659/m.44311 type:complete len:225 (-) Transcript_18659:2161-2835(-)
MHRLWAVYCWLPRHPSCRHPRGMRGPLRCVRRRRRTTGPDSWRSCGGAPPNWTGCHCKSSTVSSPCRDRKGGRGTAAACASWPIQPGPADCAGTRLSRQPGVPVPSYGSCRTTPRRWSLHKRGVARGTCPPQSAAQPPARRRCPRQSVAARPGRGSPQATHPSRGRRECRRRSHLRSPCGSSIPAAQRDRRTHPSRARSDLPNCACALRPWPRCTASRALAYCP